MRLPKVRGLTIPVRQGGLIRGVKISEVSFWFVFCRFDSFCSGFSRFDLVLLGFELF